MSYYPIDNCFLCGEKLTKLDHIDNFYNCLYCSYEIDPERSVLFILSINDTGYEVFIAKNNKISKSSIHKYKPGMDDIIYSVPEFLELSKDEWINLINRIENLEIYR